MVTTGPSSVFDVPSLDIPTKVGTCTLCAVLDGFVLLCARYMGDRPPADIAALLTLK